MANTKQAKKRVRQAEKRRQHNVSMRSSYRTAIKKVLSALNAGDSQLAEKNFHAVVPVLDKMASKGIIHKNKAARHKSRLSAQVKKLSGVDKTSAAQA